MLVLFISTKSFFFFIKFNFFFFCFWFEHLYYAKNNFISFTVLCLFVCIALRAILLWGGKGDA